MASRFWSTVTHFSPILQPYTHGFAIPINLCRQASRISSGLSSLPEPPQLSKLETPADNSQARDWVAKFRTQEVPKSLVELTFSRSSGPGGQNVNKVNTKAMLRCQVDAHWIPLWAREHLRKSPAYASSTQSILITSTVHRSQAQNVQDCLKKLHVLVLSASSAGLVTEASDEQKERVRRLELASKRHRRADKERRSSVKKSRSKDSWE